MQKKMLLLLCCYTSRFVQNDTCSAAFEVFNRSYNVFILKEIEITPLSVHVNVHDSSDNNVLSHIRSLSFIKGVI